MKKTAGLAYKLREEESHELDMLMQEGSHMLLYKEEDSKEKNNRGKKAPKEERALRKVIRKL